MSIRFSLTEYVNVKNPLEIYDAYSLHQRDLHLSSTLLYHCNHPQLHQLRISRNAELTIVERLLGFYLITLTTRTTSRFDHCYIRRLNS